MNTATHVYTHIHTQVENVPSDEDNFFVKPAVQGTETVIRACIAEGVSRVVLTSSVAAVAMGHKPPSPYHAPPGAGEDMWTQGKHACVCAHTVTNLQPAHGCVCVCVCVSCMYMYMYACIHTYICMSTFYR